MRLVTVARESHVLPNLEIPRYFVALITVPARRFDVFHNNLL